MKPLSSDEPPCLSPILHPYTLTYAFDTQRRWSSLQKHYLVKRFSVSVSNKECFSQTRSCFCMEMFCMRPAKFAYSSINTSIYATHTCFHSLRSCMRAELLLIRYLFEKCFSCSILIWMHHVCFLVSHNMPPECIYKCFPQYDASSLLSILPHLLSDVPLQTSKQEARSKKQSTRHRPCYLVCILSPRFSSASLLHTMAMSREAERKGRQ